jgi:putative tryptophan/tyrosine transport system substrate-binding protein
MQREGGQMRRREFIAGLGMTAALPLAARAQGDRVRLVGMLLPFPKSDPVVQASIRTLREELAKLGWSEGGTVKFDERWTTDNMDLVRSAAADLVELKPDVIVSSGDRAVAVLKQLTRSIPIVVLASDPVGSGFVESLARPGGNITGVSLIEFSVIGKMLEILKQMAPGIARAGIIYNPDNPVGAIYSRTFETMAKQLAVQPIDFPVHRIADIEGAFGSLTEQPNGGLLFPPDLTINGLRDQVTALASRHGVPAIYSGRSFVAAGGLVSYSVEFADLWPRLASYVDRILRGAKPADLPIQQPTKYRLDINLKTAKALGLEIPSGVLAGADDVIE